MAFCAQWNINLVTSTPDYPKAKGQAESINKGAPYSLVYGCEAVIPAEIHVPTIRSGLNTIEENQPLQQDSLTLAKELRDAAKIRIAFYQQEVARSYNKIVNIRVFKGGDLVLRKVFPNTKYKNV
ncbi:uncharacterized protein LOC141628892 [Silene latifolia]|uniref:uncharacterized protein LOC141628892 n=1 Tax=Silene latifolia TaxID=37657 RepID=UPI003D7748FA